MAAPSYTYSITNGTTADASQVQQNFTDILNGCTDGTKDLSINALTCAGTATLNGNVNLGNASADDLSITASLASTLPIKTDVTYNIGTTALRLNQVHGQEYYGIQTNTAATAGFVGEMKGKISRTYSNKVSLTSASAGFICTTTNIVLTAGDWNVRGNIGFEFHIATITDLQGWVTTSASGTVPATDTLNLPTGGEVRYSDNRSIVATGDPAAVIAISEYQVTVANGATLTLYLVGQSTFTGVGATCKAWGFLEARRAR